MGERDGGERDRERGREERERERSKRKKRRNGRNTSDLLEQLELHVPHKRDYLRRGNPSNKVKV